MIMSIAKTFQSRAILGTIVLGLLTTNAIAADKNTPNPFIDLPGAFDPHNSYVKGLSNKEKEAGITGRYQGSTPVIGKTAFYHYCANGAQMVAPITIRMNFNEATEKQLTPEDRLAIFTKLSGYIPEVFKTIQKHPGIGNIALSQGGVHDFFIQQVRGFKDAVSASYNDITVTMDIHGNIVVAEGCDTIQSVTAYNRAEKLYVETMNRIKQTRQKRKPFQGPSNKKHAHAI